MARRKKDHLSDYSSDSGDEGSDGYDEHRDDNPDERAERELFEQRSGRKKRRLNRGDGKASAWEGIFGEDDEESGRFEPRRGKRNAAFKAPTFVAKSDAQASSSKQPQAEPEVSDEDDSDDSGSSSDDNEPQAQDFQSEKRGPARTRENSYSDDEPQGGVGLGLGAARAAAGSAPPTRGGFGGIGSSRGRGGGGLGIGSARLADAGPSQGAKTFTMSSFAKSSGTEKEQVEANEANKDVQASGPRPGPVSNNDNLGGIGTAKRHQIEEAEEEALYPSDPAHAMPQSFGRDRTVTPQRARPARQQQAFRTQVEPEASSSKTKFSVPTKDLNHLRSIAGSFGARMLAKQGWTPGKGLGRDEDGKAVPIEANVGLARGQGIGKGVRTEQSRREAKERGEVLDASSEEEREKRRKKKEKKKEAVPGKGARAEWKRDKKVKVKVEHKTYDELVAEAAAGGVAAGGIGLVLDARSGELKEVSSLAELSLSARAATEWTPTGEKMQLPELRHNLRLILESTKGDVQALVKEGQAVRMKREWAKRETLRLKNEEDIEAEKFRRLEATQGVVAELATKLENIDQRAKDPLSSIAIDLHQLVDQYKSEYEEYDLDEVVIGAMVRALGIVFREWQPLADSDTLLDALRPWRKAFRYSDPDSVNEDAMLMQVYGNVEDNDRKARSSVMTPYEAMLDKHWLPRVRSALNNDWNVLDPRPAVRLLESWSPFLPRFMRDNVLNQLILPKISSQVGQWNPRRQRPGSEYSLASVVFPWLSALQDRFDGVLDEAKVRIGETMKRWSVKEAIPEEWKLWKDVFSKGKWDTMMLMNVVPKLAAHIDSDFEVNPLDQKMEPLDRVLRWSCLLRDSTLAQIIEEKFFPAWLDTLHFWLIQPNYSAGEVASWYHFWKEHFSHFKTSRGDKLTENKGIDHGFRAGLSLMNDAMTLGADATTRLVKPTFVPLTDKKSSGKKSSRGRTAAFAQPTDSEVTFRSIAEQYAADRNLLFIPTGKSHSITGKQLFKVARGLDARGVTVYVGDDAVYAQVQDGSFRAVLLDDMVKMAST